MAAGDTEKIRRYLPKLIEDARRKGEPTKTIRVGDVRNKIGVKNYSDVSRILGSEGFHSEADVRLLNKDDSKVPSGKGANVYFEFEILSSDKSKRDSVPHDSTEDTPLNSQQDLNEDFDRPEIEDLPTTPFVNDGEAGITSSLLERILKLSPDEFENLVGGIPGSKGIFGCRSHRQVLRRWDRRSLRHSFHKCEGGFSGETICDWKQRRN